jgi:hypothetical protein
MKKLFPLLFVIALFVACASGGWRVVSGDEFSVEFPGEPKDTATMEGDYSGAKLYFQPVEGGIDSNVYYSVSMYTLPDSAEQMGELLDEMLLKDAEIYAWAIGAIVTDSGKVVKSGNVEGREYKIFLARNAGVVTMRKYAKGKHLYTLMVITGNEFLENSLIYRFLNSFKFKE